MVLMPGRIGRISAFKLPGMMELMPDRISRICALELMPSRIQSKNETVHIYKYNITFIDNILLKKNPTKLYNEAEVDLSSKSTGYIKLLQF